MQTRAEFLNKTRDLASTAHCVTGVGGLTSLCLIGEPEQGQYLLLSGSYPAVSKA